jgi:hypothetical protein
MSPAYQPENDSFCIITETSALSDMMDLDELLPIEKEELLAESRKMQERFYPHRPTKSVCFAGIQSVDLIESSTEMSDEEKHQIWFSASELEQFKSNARNLCRQQCKGVPTTDSTRGMDVYFPSRQRNHAKYIFHMVYAYHVQCAGNPDYLAQLAEKWSAKSTERALVAGRQDFYEAHMIQQTEVPSTSTQSRKSSKPVRAH